MKHNNFTRLCASWVFLLVLSLPVSLFSQCECDSPDPSNPDPLHAQSDCMVLIDDSVLDDLTPCTGPYTFQVFDQFGNLIASGTPDVMVDLSSYVGQNITVKVMENGSVEMCTNYYRVIDETAPMITCPSDTIFCTEYPAMIKPVIASDNCDGGVSINVPSEIRDGFGAPCQPGEFYGKITWSFTATDDSGNTASCDQEIFVLKSDTTDVEFPKDTVLQCTQSADVSITGVPTINGRPIVNNGVCNIELFAPVDDTTSLCGGGMLIRRTWSILNACTSTNVDSVQLIRMVDTVPPVVTCQTNIVFPTDTSECAADIVLPTPTVTDNCSLFKIEANIPGQSGNGLAFDNVPEGQYVMNYVVTDSCGNVSLCEATLTIEDDETPTAVCDGIKVVSLSSNGEAILEAEAFDDGSTDNCIPFVLLDFEVNRDGGAFGPTVTFTCADVGPDTIMVQTKVIDSTNPSSFNICMTRVLVNDKLAPALTCPLPTTIDCEADYSDLSVFGTAFIMDGCDFTTVIDSVFNISQCGTGTITRTWTVTDASDNESTCMQTITVENQTPFDGTSIVFPADYFDTSNNCTLPSDLEPSDLPAGFDQPVVPAQACAMIAMSYSDMVFEIDFPACYKIVRTWKVMDWCQYDPSTPGVGLWQEQQVIAVMHTLPPNITFCPPSDTFALDATCTFGNVQILSATALADCTNEDLTITNDSPFAISNGANASGLYPEGVHTIKYTVTDGCGNKSYCSNTITVTDLKLPTPACKDGLIGELQFMENATPEIMAVVTADQLDYFSFDNCTAADDLVFTIRLVGNTDPPVPSLVFDCDGEGVHDVEVWVTDEAGNSDFCLTQVTIQDNMNLCNDDPVVVNNAMIGGGIATLMGEELPEVHVDINPASMSYMTDGAGNYEFEGLGVGSNYAVTPWKDDGPLNGVTTFDLVLISRHVLNIAPLDSPYKLIAADVNNSGSITTYDVVQLRKLILQVYYDFPDNDSWRFVKADYNFPDPQNPFSPAYPETANFVNLSNDVTDADFIAVKIGDVNGSASANFNGSNVDERSAGKMNILLEDREVAAGEEFTLPFRLDQDFNLLALQFTLEFETDLELQGIEKGTLSGVAGDRFDISRHSAGVLTGAWYHTSPVMATKDAALFSLRFKSKRAGRLSEMIAMTSRYTEALAYDDQEIPIHPNLAFSNPTNMQTSTAFQLLQNQPNPFKKVTNIGFTLPETSQAQLVIYDIAGNVLRTYDQVFEQGYNEVSIKRQELPTGGVLFYQLQTPTNTATKKMILLQ
ncbi:MAG TPA: HYR domain-containing protein [Bacteroidetes bacterium]|nr:HYR domain-containing protein [Bacteroidota bacterium]